MDEFKNRSNKMYTVKPLKTATLRGMQKWPSYRGGRLMETFIYQQLSLKTYLEGYQG